MTRDSGSERRGNVTDDGKALWSTQATAAIPLTLEDQASSTLLAWMWKSGKFLLLATPSRGNKQPSTVVSCEATSGLRMAEPAKDLSQECDLLAAVVSLDDDASRERAIETLLVDHAQRTIRRVLLSNRQIIQAQDFDDVTSSVNLRIVRRLRLLDQEPIDSFDDYVATITYNVVYDFLRSRYPQRMRLKNRVRYALSRDQRFAIWETHSGTAAGFAAWGGREPGRPPASPASIVAGTSGDPKRTAKAIAAVFAHTGAPLLLDDLIDLLAEAWNVRDLHVVPAEIATTQAASPAAQYESRQYLTSLWNEVRMLRPAQRAALLLNLRDGDGRNALALLVLARIATTAQIAEAAGITPLRMTELWSDLPLDDLSIASMLGCTRQQVINLRKAARERLGRRMNFGRREP
jgi:DNA-directed RNA polymerase specialized sigma24 family protein